MVLGVGTAVNDAVRLAWKKPEKLTLRKGVAALANHIGHRSSHHEIDFQFAVMVGFEPRNPMGILGKKSKPAVFLAVLQIFKHTPSVL